MFAPPASSPCRHPAAPPGSPLPLGALRAARQLALALALATGTLACKGDRSEPPAAAPAPAAAAPAPPSAAATAAPWFAGTAEAAFAEASATGKPVFLYWGAKWCPPCNALKAEVFEKPRFAELVRGLVPVHLDGDTSEAQGLGEKLGVSSYPTVLVLSSTGEEWLRLNGAFDLPELEEALGAAIGSGSGFEAAARRLGEGAATPADFRLLAAAAWELLPASRWSPPRRLAALLQAALRCPPELRRERAMLAAQALGLAAAEGSSADGDVTLRELRSKAPELLDAIFADAETVRAARVFVTMRAGDVLRFLHGEKPSSAEIALKARWLAAAAALGAREDVSIETRLWSLRPALEIHRREHPLGPLPAAQRAAIEQAVDAAIAGAKGRAERHATVTGAAYLLRRADAHDRARALLLAESERDPTPFYYYSSLAALEQELGRLAEARAFSAKARESAEGRATRLQWIAADVLHNAASDLPEQRAYVLGLVDELYALAVELGDGFSGRNLTRLEQVAGALAPRRAEPELRSLLARHRARCPKGSPEARASCEAHFDAQVPGP